MSNLPFPRLGMPSRRHILFLNGERQAEKPFKAYVRRSRIETIVWYSAYPTLAPVNINANCDFGRHCLSQALRTNWTRFF